MTALVVTLVVLGSVALYAVAAGLTYRLTFWMWRPDWVDTPLLAFLAAIWPVGLPAALMFRLAQGVCGIGRRR